MKKIPITKKQDKAITFVLVLIIIILINAIAMQFSFAMDMTADNVYSLSKESELMLRSLNSPMSVRVFITPNMPPPFSTYERYLRDLLAQYQSASRGNFSYEIIDASKDNSASAYGIQATQISVLEKDQTQTKIAYMGLAMLYGESVETIPFVNSTEGLEYNISTLIRKMIDKNDQLLRLDGNLDVNLIVSSEVIPLLPQGAFEMLPIAVNEAVNEANKSLMNKVVFKNIDSKSPSSQTLLTDLGVEKIQWNEIIAPNGDIVVPSGEGYFSLVLANGSNKRHLNMSALIQGTQEDVVKEIQAGIDSLLRLEKTIGYLDGNGEAQYFVIPPQYGGTADAAANTVADFVNQINTSYSFAPVNIKNTPIPDNIDVLIIAGSQEELTDYELYQIDQFIMKGNPVLFMQNGVTIDSENEMVQMGAMPPTLKVHASKINAMLGTYGIISGENFIFDTESYKASFEQGAPPQSIYYIPLILPENIDAKNPVTKSIKLLFTPLVSEVLHITNENNVRFTPLVYTSKGSWSEGEGFAFTPQTLYPPSDETRLGRRVIAATLDGEMNSAFDGLPIPKPEPMEGEELSSNFDIPNPLIRSTTRGRIAVIGSYEMAKNNAFNINDIFLMNVVDWMAGNNDLMSIRRKGVTYNPPFNIGDTGKTFVRVVNIAVLPLGVILFGILLWRMDKRRKLAIAKRFQK